MMRTGLSSGDLTAERVVGVVTLTSPLSVRFLSPLWSEAVAAADQFPGPRRQAI